MSNHLNPNDAKAYTRRAFLQHSTLFASAAMTVPAFLQSSAFALPRPMLGLSSIAGVDEDRVLVVIQMSGGNDGLNTLVPVGDDAYHRVRPRIALSASEVLMFERNGGLGLHGSMSGFKDLYDEGMCAIVQGVGYPNPNRSESMWIRSAVGMDRGLPARNNNPLLQPPHLRWLRLGRSHRSRCMAGR